MKMCKSCYGNWLRQLSILEREFVWASPASVSAKSVSSHEASERSGQLTINWQVSARAARTFSDPSGEQTRAFSSPPALGNFFLFLYILASRFQMSLLIFSAEKGHRAGLWLLLREG